MKEDAAMFGRVVFWVALWAATVAVIVWLLTSVNVNWTDDLLRNQRLLEDPPLEVLKEEVDHQQVTDHAPVCWPYLGPRSDDSDKAFARYVGSLERDTQRLIAATERVESAALYNPKAGWERYEAFESAWGRLTDTARTAVAACVEFPDWVPQVINRHVTETFWRVVVPVREACQDIGITGWGTPETTGRCVAVDEFPVMSAVNQHEEHGPGFSP